MEIVSAQKVMHSMEAIAESRRNAVISSINEKLLEFDKHSVCYGAMNTQGLYAVPLSCSDEIVLNMIRKAGWDLRLSPKNGGCPIGMEWNICLPVQKNSLTSVEPNTTASQPVNPECGAG